MNNSKERRPGDLILDRYMPNATEEEREEARANLAAYAAAVIAIQQRLERESVEKAIRQNPADSVDSEAQP